MKIKDNKTLKNVIIFSIVALSCGWIGRLVDLQAGTDENGSLGQLIWIVSPLLTDGDYAQLDGRWVERFWHQT